MLGSGTLSIGRDPASASSMVIDDDQVSRKHAMVERSTEGVGFFLTDLESRNGTFFNGRKCRTSAISDGDVIRMGSHLLLFQAFSLEECRQLQVSPSVYDSALVGPAVRTQMVRQKILDEAPKDVPVLILGESGVGKELVARELHEKSQREGRFVAVNCAALPDHLVESELFGHVSGAFTGAKDTRPGLFAEAEGGTLFLDEIGETALPIQAKLLRALATGEVRAVGATHSRTIDTRVVAATNVDLESAVDAGSFRADLYARLMGAVTRVPRLRDRREDILSLTEHFLSAAGAGAFEISPDAAEALLVWNWRFNVRELEQLLRGIAHEVESAGILDLDLLPSDMRTLLDERSTETDPSTQIPIVLRVRRDVAPDAAALVEVLEHFDGNMSKVGEFFGKDRRQIYRWAERLDVDLTRFRKS